MANPGAGRSGRRGRDARSGWRGRERAERLERLERAAGIEPASSAWKAEVLPLHNARVTAPGCMAWARQGQVARRVRPSGARARRRLFARPSALHRPLHVARGRTPLLRVPDRRKCAPGARRAQPGERGAPRARPRPAPRRATCPGPSTGRTDAHSVTGAKYRWFGFPPAWGACVPRGSAPPGWHGDGARRGWRVGGLAGWRIDGSRP